MGKLELLYWIQIIILTIMNLKLFIFGMTEKLMRVLIWKMSLHGCQSHLLTRYSKRTRMYLNGLKRKEIRYENRRSKIKEILSK